MWLTFCMPVLQSVVFFGVIVSTECLERFFSGSMLNIKTMIRKYHKMSMRTQVYQNNCEKRVILNVTFLSEYKT